MSERRSSKQLMKLVYIQLLQIMSINEVIHSKDKKKKHNLYMILSAYILVGIMFIFYIGGGAYGLCVIGAAEIVPAYVLSVASIVIFIFSMFKAGNMLFQVKNYEMLISLPVKPVTIVMSRMINMYLGNLGMSFLTMLPAGIIYGVITDASAVFYLMFSFSIFILPLIPITAASIIGAVITAIGSRMKHKNAVTIFVSMLLVIGMIVLPFLLSLTKPEITVKELSDFTGILADQINKMYPLARMYTDAVVYGSFTSYAGFVGISISIFLIFTLIVQNRYAVICMGLISHRAGKNYVMEKQASRKPLIALYKKELKRYFSSTIYVMNTAIGYVMMIGFAAALLFMGENKLEQMFQIEGIVEKMFPFILALMGMMGTTTTASISIEGKQWWIIKSLPISTQIVLGSKLLVNLTLALPSCILAAAISTASFGFRGLDTVWLFLIPVSYCLFASVSGLAANIRFANFNWDNEATVVKQGGAVFAGLLIEFLSGFIGIGLLFILGNIQKDIIMIMIVLILMTLTAVIYKKIMKYDLRMLN